MIIFCLFHAIFLSLLSFRTTSDLNNTPIWLDDWVYCYYRLDFTTPDLRNCSRAVGVHNCLHSEDVILTCNSGTKPKSCSQHKL